MENQMLANDSCPFCALKSIGQRVHPASTLLQHFQLADRHATQPCDFPNPSILAGSLPAVSSACIRPRHAAQGMVSRPEYRAGRGRAFRPRTGNIGPVSRAESDPERPTARDRVHRSAQLRHRRRLVLGQPDGGTVLHRFADRIRTRARLAAETGTSERNAGAFRACSTFVQCTGSSRRIQLPQRLSERRLRGLQTFIHEPCPHKARTCVRSAFALRHR